MNTSKRIIQLSDIGPSPLPRPDLWTVIVAAAGRGSRLGWHQPKILFPVAGKTILQRLIDTFKTSCSQFVFVLSPDGGPVVTPELEANLPGRFQVAIQQTPLGMADAVAQGLSKINTPFVAVVWGDQAALKSRTIEIATLALVDSNHLAAFPSVLTNHPYIHFERDSEDRLTGVRQAREGDLMPTEGEADAGLFFFRTSALRELLPIYLTCESCRGRKTLEYNFLPILPYLDQQGEGVLSIRGIDSREALGINSVLDAQQMEKIFLDEINHD